MNSSLDVFVKNLTDKYYGLDPCHYFSSPGLIWDAMLRMTGIELELISDNDMHLFIQKGMRRGIFILLKDIVKQIIDTCNRMTIVFKCKQFI